MNNFKMYQDFSELFNFEHFKEVMTESKQENNYITR